MKKIFLAIAIAAIAGVNVYNADMHKNQLSDLQLSNIEMLAEAENDHFLCCNNIVGCCDYGDFEIDGDWVD